MSSCDVCTQLACLYQPRSVTSTICLIKALLSEPRLIQRAQDSVQQQPWRVRPSDSLEHLEHRLAGLRVQDSHSVHELGNVIACQARSCNSRAVSRQHMAALAKATTGHEKQFQHVVLWPPTREQAGPICCPTILQCRCMQIRHWRCCAGAGQKRDRLLGLLLPRHLDAALSGRFTLHYLRCQQHTKMPVAGLLGCVLA